MIHIYIDHTYVVYTHTHLNKVEEMNLYNIYFNDVESVGFHLTTSNSTIVLLRTDNARENSLNSFTNELNGVLPFSLLPR